MTTLEMFLLTAGALLFVGLGWLWGQVRLIDGLAERLRPQLQDELDDLRAAQAADAPRREELQARELAVLSREMACKRLEDKNKRLSAELESLNGDETRRRVLWLSQQLAAHLTPAGVATLVSREALPDAEEARSD